MKQALFPFVIPLILAVFLFTSAGRVDLPFFWAAILLALILGLALGPRIDRDLINERMSPAAGGCDRHLRTIGAPLMFIQLIVAGLDVGRFHWSDTVPLAFQALGLAGFAAGLVFCGWAVVTNRFFSPVVRIQSERGHHVVTTGPYAWVRHPGYTGTIIAWPSLSLALGSWYSLLPLVPMLLLVVRRAIIEDRYLHENLDGYRDYAAKTRYRLLPGVW